MIIKWVSVFASVLVLASEASPMLCEEKWSEISRRIASSNIEVLIYEWESVSEKCIDRDLYQLRRVILEIENKEYLNAVKMIDAALKKGNKYKKELRLKGIVSVVNHAANQGIISHKDIARFMSYYDSVVKAYPEWWEVYAEYGSFLSLVDKDQMAESYIRKSIELRSTHYAYGLLMNLKYREKDYSGVVSIFEDVQKKDDSIYHVSSIIYILAKSYAELGQIDLAQKAIEVLVDRKPDVLNTSGLDETIDYINGIHRRIKN